MAREQSRNELMVIEKVSLVDYYNKVVLPLDKKFKPISEERNTGLCPFHQDTDPSLHYWKRKNIFHCFGCGFGGDVVKTHMQMRRQHYGEKPTIADTIEQLAHMFGIELDKETGFVVKSVFEQAREKLLEKETYIIPRNVLSIAEFRQLNNKVKSSNVPVRVKIQNFEHLDLVASIASNSK